ncbi:amidohydrolase family protein [Streptomyces sp. NPDC026294]|uniref:amidohydrolase family protein n=1 Tax=Streptomyces sp. NPDC026294 TaxID=3155362 RepID=UPI0033D73B57
MLLITAERVLVSADTYLRDGAVLIDGQTIIAVGSREQVSRQAGADARRISFSGTVIPGLIDAHVHLIFDGSPDPVAALDSTDEALLDQMRQRADELLHTGVTTVRDLGDRNGLAFRVSQEIEADSRPGPRILAAGTPATPPGGHCYFLGGEVSGETAVRELVQRNIAAGAAVIKVMTSGGGLTKGGPRSWQSQFSRKELQALVEEAHSAGLPVAAHAHGADAITEAVDAGVDTLEHCTWMTEDGFDLRHDVLQRIIEQKIAVSMTVSPHWRMLPKVFGEERATLMFDQVRQMAEAGANMIVGTDAGVQRTGFDGLPRALTFYAHLGIPNSTALDMATRRAAEALGLGEVTGRIAPDFQADLLLVDGDPLQGLEALQRVRTVIAAGKSYEQE